MDLIDLHINDGAVTIEVNKPIGVMGKHTRWYTYSIPYANRWINMIQHNPYQYILNNQTFASLS